MFELKIITAFAAAHQLKMVSEKCENLHGHNWKIEVCVQGANLTEAGVLIDFGEFKKYVSEVIETLDHKFLNELEPFKEENPSSENIAHYIYESLSQTLNNDAIRVSKVTAWESDTACATYMVP